MMKLIYITRRFPPSTGGMENFSYALTKELAKKSDLSLIKWGYSQIWLIYFLPYALIKASFLIIFRRIKYVHLGDGLLSPIGFLLKLIGAQVSVTVHGLDVTYKLPIYQWIIPFFLKRLDKIICISDATLEECLKRGVPYEKCSIITPGVYPEDFAVKTANKIFGDKKVLVTVGRLIKRKGVFWFVENVMPKLPKDFVYVVVGDGPERARIEQAIASNNLQDQVKLLGKVSDEELKKIYHSSDIFIMPNIPVPGDMEGFGIVAIEAGSAGLPVIASNLEGIKNSVIDKVTGYLAEPENEKDYLRLIKQNDLDRRKILAEIISRYRWNTIAERYMETLYG